MLRTTENNQMKESFNLDDVEKLIINAYEVGFCDGRDSEKHTGSDFRVYKNSKDFWKKNYRNWIRKGINYGT